MVVEGCVIEHALDARLTIVEIAAHAVNADIVAFLRRHLLELDIAHATVRIEDDDGDMLAIGKPLQGSLAGIPARSHGDKVVVIRCTSGALLVHACREEDRQALQCHVLECARGPVPQLEHVHAIGDLDNRTDIGRVEVLVIRAPHELVDLLVIEVDAKALVHEGRALGIGHLGKRHDLVERHRGQLLGNEQATTGRHALEKGLAEGQGIVRVATRVDIADFHARLQGRVNVR